jgi:eukaryotic-like serine/threonine-protein kinase
MNLTYGPYRTVRLLGEGAMGRVFLALDQTSGRPVALKLLPLSTAGDEQTQQESRSRFLVEAYATRGLSHPHVAAVLDAGESGRHGWIAMEFVPGADLSRYIRPARLLPEAVVLQVVGKVALALAHAHRAGIVHRDVKPSNVRVDWATHTVKLTDFGLARPDDAEATRTGLVLGSPSYMAPELLAGGLPTPRSDLYALGVMLFELLCGRLPHEAPTLGELLRSVATRPAPDLLGLRPDLGADLAGLVAQLLLTDPAQRPSAAADVATRLAELARAAAPAAGSATGPKSHP